MAAEPGMALLFRIQLIALACCLLAGSPVAAGDTASNLPASLADSLRPVTDVKLDDLDEQARNSIQLARRQLNEALQAQPGKADALAAAYGELGGLYHVHFVYTAAEDCYHNAMQLAPDDFRWAYYAAYLAAEEGRTRLALQRFEHARTLKPGYKALVVRRGNVLLDLNEPDRARAAFTEVVNATGLEAASLYGLGQVALLTRDYPTAIDAFSRALEHDPAASSIHFPLAQALRAMQRNDEAKAQLANSGKQLPAFIDPQIDSLKALKIGSRIHFIQGMRAARQRDYAAAGEAFAQGLALEPDNARARISYARALYLDANKAGARQALEAALARQPDDSLGLFLLGILTEEAGEPDRAAAYYQRAVRQAPTHTGANQYLADYYYRQGNYALAAQHYASSIKGEADNLVASIPYLGALLLGKAPAATLMAALETAIERFPEYPFFRSLQVLLLAGSRDAEIHDPQAALKSAQQLYDRYRIPPHQELLALAFAATGDYPKATAIQQELLSYVRSAMPAEADRVAQILADYENNTLPPLDKLINYAALQPAPFNAAAVFSEYPTPRPY